MERVMPPVTGSQKVDDQGKYLNLPSSRGEVAGQVMENFRKRMLRRLDY